MRREDFSHTPGGGFRCKTGQCDAGLRPAGFWLRCGFLLRNSDRVACRQKVCFYALDTWTFRLAKYLRTDAPETDQNELHYSRMTRRGTATHQFSPGWKKPSIFGGETKCK